MGNKLDEEAPKKDGVAKEKAKMIFCYICKKDHYTKNFPLRPQKLVVVEHEGHSVGVLQVLNAVLEEPGVSTETDFTKPSYVPVELNRQQVFALVDSGVTHNFIQEERAD